jgi:tetratricopeptide (TPR) repeat protein
MLRLNRSFAIKVISRVIFLFPLLFLAQNGYAANVISGAVFDKQGTPVASVDVELLDEYYRLLQRMRTDSVGRYSFGGLNNGNYTVKVLPFQYDLEDQSVYIEVAAISARPGDPGSSYINQDFYLQPKKGGLRYAELSVVFAQEVPKEAEKTYKKAIGNLSGKRADEGLNQLREALKIFPDYYLALYRLGHELILKKEYGEAVQVFIKAGEINPKSASAFYYVGYALYNLGRDYDKAAVRSLNHAYTLAPASVQILWLLGKVERDMGKYSEAEKHLLQAKKIALNKIPEIHEELYKLYREDLKKYREAADELELYLKASRLKDAEEKKVKKVIGELREKAQTS